MNVTCTGCPAKYSVPDEKVRGKKVRITCKHCGTNIVVDGSALGASQSVLPSTEPAAAPTAVAAPAPATAAATATTAGRAAATPVAQSAAKPAAAAPALAAESTWLVGFVDDRQEQHTTSEVVDLYAAGKIDDETLVWKDGMDDWLSPFDVPEIGAVLKQRGVPRRAPSFALPSSSDDEATVVGRSPFDDETVVSSAPSESEPPAKSPIMPASAARDVAPEIKPSATALRPSFGEAKPAAAMRQSTPEIQPAAVKPAAAIRQSTPEIQPASKPSAARRTDKRAEVDLFGSVASAGSEADVSLDFGAPEEPAQKLTGARNESSVLFSLDALTKPDPKTSQSKAQDKKEKDATAVLFGESSPDSLMNVGGGGLAALAAPDFTKPVAAAPEPVRPSDPVEVPNASPGKKKGGAGLLIAAVVGIAAAAGIAFVVMSKKPAEKPAESAVAEPKAAAPSTPAATATATAADTAAPTAAPDTANSAPSAAEPSSATSAASAAAAKPVAGAATTTATATTTAAPGTPAKPADKPADTKKTDAPAAPAAPAGGADFDKAAAVAALGAAAANAASCKKPDGPTGDGKASVTFAPSGRATNSTVSGALAGTDVGGCVARIFRAAKVPPFSGDPVTVSKSFSVE